MSALQDQTTIMPADLLYAARIITTCVDRNLTNIELNQFLYICQLRFIGETAGTPLFDAIFEARRCGPMIPGMEKIAMLRSERNHLENDSKADGTKRFHYMFIVDVIEDYEELNQKELLEVTTRKGGAWDVIHSAGTEGQIITNTAMIRDYYQREALI